MAISLFQEAKDILEATEFRTGVGISTEKAVARKLRGNPAAASIFILPASRGVDQC